MDTTLDGIKTEIKAQAIKLGADLVGFASVDRFLEAPEGFRPTDIMPRAKSVIVIAKRGPREVVRNKRRLTTYYHVFCTITGQLDQIAYQLSYFIEDQGFRAYPVPSDSPYTAWDEENMHGRGDLSHRHAGAAAGLGVLGKNTLLITPRYGNRIQLVSIISDLEVNPDPLVEEDLCPEDCRVCLDACPVGALDGTTVVQKLCREHIATTLPRGFSVYSCWECRRVCPAGRADGNGA
ncbi:MAG TPA: epoxyqueuosine reductase [Syntrophomonadaceae bacterium]|nr:epoxyqueuosine reductase [Syntrophomonadaceae bacterium]